VVQHGIHFTCFHVEGVRVVDESVEGIRIAEMEERDCWRETGKGMAHGQAHVVTMDVPAEAMSIATT
jgi:hypothetical protein